jgi:acetolactate synthase-1/2/3 large subunit
LFKPVLSGDVDVCDAIVGVLAEAGVEYVAGIPGGNTAGIFNALFAHPTVRTVLVREESIATAMAEAYGRMTGRPLVVMGQGEWIAGVAGLGSIEALLSGSPMVILTEMSDGGPLSHHGFYQSGSGDFGSWDALSALRGMTKRVMVSNYPAQAVQHTQLALKHALSGQPGPVAVIYTAAALEGTVGLQSKPRIYPTSPYLPTRASSVSLASVRAASEALHAAAAPVIVAGNGVRVGRACTNLAELARALDAPVATTAGGKGVYCETDELSVGVIGQFGSPVANTVVAESDVVLAVGTKLAPIDTREEDPALLDPERQTFIQIDIEPLHVSWVYPVEHQLVGDAGYVMDRLRDALGGTGGSREAASARLAAVRARFPEDATAASSDETPLLPQRTIALLQEAIPPGAVVTTDAGENRIFMLHWYRAKSADSYLMPSGGGGMGYAIPAAMGAKLARPDCDVVAVCGDGGFAMSMHALMTAVQEEIPITVVVLNNDALGWVLHLYEDRPLASTFTHFDHAAIARAMGCDAVVARDVSDLRSALTTIQERSRPLVIDVATSRKTSFRDVEEPFHGVLVPDRAQR